MRDNSLLFNQQNQNVNRNIENFDDTFNNLIVTAEFDDMSV